MPKYRYIARNNAGRTVRGEAAAADEAELHRCLGEEGLLLVSSGKVSQRVRRRALEPNVLSDFNRQLAQLTGAGVSLVRAMNIIIRQESVKPSERAVYENVMRLVRQGSFLSDAMEQQSAFPPLMVSMYRAAESGGNLDATAQRLAEHYKNEYRISQKIKNTTTYPKIVLAVTLAAVMLVVLFVLPQFKDMFEQMENVPAATAALFAVEGFVKEQYVLIIALIGFIAVLSGPAGRIPSVAYYRDKLSVKLPVIGKLKKTIFSARFAATLSSLYSAGIPIVTALRISAGTIGNCYITSQFNALISEVRAGGNLSSAVEHIDGFVKKLSAAIRVGEETGALDNMLNATADALEYDAENAMKKMVGYLEPALIMLLGVLIGFIMLAVILPILNSYSAIEQGAYF